MKPLDEEDTVRVRKDSVTPSGVFNAKAPTSVQPDTRKAHAAVESLDAFKREQGWLEDIWWDDFDSELSLDVEHPNDQLVADIFLARVQIPATDGTPPTLNTTIDPVIANEGRRMVYSAADLIALGQ